MKRTATIFLQTVLALIGVGIFALLLWEPHLEGVNANAGFWEVYLDPFIALLYIGAIPFFVALFQAIRLLGFAGTNNVFSAEAVRSLRTITYCGLAIIGFVAADELIIALNHGNDDAAGAMMLGLIIAFGATVVAVAAAVFERILQNAVTLKAEHDLTV